ncbi:hypothetical protein PMAYCL1PPCAC_24189 [Pristionchus mayeri]|uniref:Uncharacterized protein n=1 Tax=Pristionchus mayeri TaxID=1317129 RepID=A0AAN5D1P8_9BILA|nr:hypothetical protein PMAYCL1PPCAC_24189 [Pristionchus mayeri]
MLNRIELRCSECSFSLADSTVASNGDSIEFWWCRDCNIGVCKSCHLLRGHSEHRSNGWKAEEVLRAAVQALEGRCSRRAKSMHDTKIAVKQFIAKVEVFLLNELNRALEAVNESDRLMIAKLNRANLHYEEEDSRPSLYHLPSPTRPAWKTWNLDQENPRRMEELLETVRELLQLPRGDKFEEETLLELKERSEWNVRVAAEAVAAAMGARFVTEHGSRSASPDLSWIDGSGSIPNGKPRRRAASSDTASHASSLPLEPSVFEQNGVKVEYRLKKIGFVRERPSVMSFRERSIAPEGTASPGSPDPSHMSNDSHKGGPNSTYSSHPRYPLEDGLNTTYTSSDTGITPTPTRPPTTSTPKKKEKAPIADSETTTSGTPDRGPFSMSPSCTPVSFGPSFLTRPICVHSFSTKTFPNALAVSDSCGGVYICTPGGSILHHLLIKNSSASSLAVDEQNEILYVSVMQAKGRSVHVFDVADSFKKLDTLACPKDPKIEMSRTRWLTVAPRGQLFMTTGDNHKSALWAYVRGKKGWKLLKESRKTRYQYLSVAEDQAEYKAVVLLTCDAANNRLLLFVVDHSLSLINEYDLSKTYRLNDHIASPASAIVDKHGNLIVLDYASGKVWILLSGVKGVRRLKEIPTEEPLNPQEALGITATGDYILVAVFARQSIISTRYLDEGVFPSLRSPSLSRRSQSLPRSAVPESLSESAV